MENITNASPSVLIVEDEKELGELLADRFRDEGMKPYAANRVGSAITMLLNQKFGCIILDMNLDTGAGEQVIAAIRRDANHVNHGTPIVVMSAFLESERLQKILKDINYALVKPFDRDILIEKVRGVLGDRVNARLA